MKTITEITAIIETIFDAIIAMDSDDTRLDAVLADAGLTRAEYDAWCAYEDAPEAEDEWVWEDPWDE